MNFLKLYKIESKKLLKSKSFIVVLSIIFIMIILCSLLFEMLSSSGADELTDIIYQVTNLGNSGASVEEIITMLETRIGEYDAVQHSILDTTGHQLRSMLTAYQFIAENNLPVETVVFNATTAFFAGGAAGYINTVLMVTSSIVLIYVVTMAASGIMSEIHNGTMKTVLLRPVKRSTLFSAKYTSLFSITVGLQLIAMILALIYGAIRFKITAADMVVPFNGTTAFLSNAYGIMLLTFLFNNIMTFAYMQMSYFTANIFSNKTAGMVIPMSMVFFGDFMVLAGVFSRLSYVGFIFNTDLTRYLGTSGAVYQGYNFYLSIVICVLWIVGLTVYNYFNFKRRDIN